MKKTKKKVVTRSVAKKQPTNNKNKKSASPAVSRFGALGVLPMGDRVLIKPEAPEEMTSFGLIIPDTAKEKPEHGIVVAVGPGRRGDDNDLVPMGVQVGDKVMFSKYGFDEIKVDGVEYYILPESSILAVISK
jgi:chaperonin GroES